jgi:hypothetical protein
MQFLLDVTGSIVGGCVGQICRYLVVYTKLLLQPREIRMLFLYKLDPSLSQNVGHLFAVSESLLYVSLVIPFLHDKYCGDCFEQCFPKPNISPSSQVL